MHNAQVQSGAPPLVLVCGPFVPPLLLAPPGKFVLQNKFATSQSVPQTPNAPPHNNAQIINVLQSPPGLVPPIHNVQLVKSVHLVHAKLATVSQIPIVHPPNNVQTINVLQSQPPRTILGS